MHCLRWAAACLKHSCACCAVNVKCGCSKAGAYAVTHACIQPVLPVHDSSSMPGMCQLRQHAVRLAATGASRQQPAAALPGASHAHTLTAHAERCAQTSTHAVVIHITPAQLSSSASTAHNSQTNHVPAAPPAPPPSPACPCCCTASTHRPTHPHPPSTFPPPPLLLLLLTAAAHCPPPPPPPPAPAPGPPGGGRPDLPRDRQALPSQQGHPQPAAQRGRVLREQSGMAAACCQEHYMNGVH